MSDAPTTLREAITLQVQVREYRGRFEACGWWTYDPTTTHQIGWGWTPGVTEGTYSAVDYSEALAVATIRRQAEAELTLFEKGEIGEWRDVDAQAPVYRVS